MKTKTRLIGLLLALITVCTALAGCSGRGDGDPPVWTDDDEVVLTLGGSNVTRDFYRYLFLNTKKFYDNGDESYWLEEGNDVEKIKNDVLDSLYETYGMFVLADRYNITLTEDDKEYIDNYIKESKAGMSNSEYKESLKASYMTEDLYRFLLEIQLLENNVYYYITTEENGVLEVSDDMVLEAINSDFVRATHILFTYKDEADKQVQYEKAEQVLAQLKAGEDFETLKEKHSADTALTNNKDGYYFTHGEFANAFEDTSFALEVGEISEIVQSNVGYHIVKRLPIEKEYVDEHFSELRTQYYTALYYKMVEEEYKQFTPKYKSDYKNIKLDTFN